MGNPADLSVFIFRLLFYSPSHRNCISRLIIRKGQALQFNWLFEKGAFVLHADETFSVDFNKVLNY